MQVVKIIFNSFSVNTYVLFDETKEAIIIDPGCNSPEEKQKFAEFFKEKGLKPVKIVNTHCHIDHILGVDFMKDTFGIEFYASKDDEYLIENAMISSEMFGLGLAKAPKIDNYISEKDEIKFGNSSLKILEVPGHCNGHLAFYSDVDKFVITGDVLFKDSIGRTDLPGGDLDVLMNSIFTKILPLGDDYAVLAGHMGNSDIGTERKNNPFL
jgi:hydroxyacylglutathione hydrolase